MPRRQVTYSNHPNHRARMVHAQGERQFRTYDTSHIRPRKSKGPVIVGIVLAIVVVLALVFGVSVALKGCSGGNVDGSAVVVESIPLLFCRARAWFPTPRRFCRAPKRWGLIANSRLVPTRFRAA